MIFRVDGCESDPPSQQQYYIGENFFAMCDYDARDSRQEQQATTITVATTGSSSHNASVGQFDECMACLAIIAHLKPEDTPYIAFKLVKALQVVPPSNFTLHRLATLWTSLVRKAGGLASLGNC